PFRSQTEACCGSTASTSPSGRDSLTASGSSFSMAAMRAQRHRRRRGDKTMNASRLAVLVAVATAVWIIVAWFPSSAHAQQDLLVSARFGNNVLRYAGDTGDPQGQFDMGPPLSNPAGLALDPDGNVYVANFNTNEVLEYSPDGTFLGVFASSADGLGFPLALRFGPDDNLYVTSNLTPGVYEFSGLTGDFIGVFASVGSFCGANRFFRLSPIGLIA